MTLTAAQREVARAVEGHVLVSAGAGTGKTTTVVARILYLLGVRVAGQAIREPLDLGRIAAITFTNAAAADLKGKLRLALREAGRHETAHEVDTARIGTIHAFCGDLLREFALRHGRAPARDVLSEGEGNAIRAEAVRDGLLMALESRSVAGLDGLLSECSVREVEAYLAQLLTETDRLRAVAAHRDALGERERVLVDLAVEVVRLVDTRLAERGAVDFDRMIVWTRDLLRDDSYVRRVLQRRLHTLIVDEFQDVDPAQKEIAYLLGDPGGRRQDTTRLLFVGDPKQSIYRFRRADVTVWRDVEGDFATGGLGQVIPLTENFRSTAALLGFVDATVGAILDEPIDGRAHQPYEVPYQSLSARSGRKKTAPEVELLLVPPRDNGKDFSVPVIRRLEARALARRARALHDQEGVGWSDMALLLASWADLGIYQTALEAEGVPSYALRATGFWERREIVDLIVALEAIRDPHDDTALFGFLRSPTVGLPDETLLALATTQQQPFWSHLDTVDVPDADRLARGRQLLRRHVRLRDRLPTDQLLESFLHESGYLAHLALLGDRGAQALANVRKLLGLTRTMRKLGLGEFLRVVRETRSRGDLEPDARLHGQGDDVFTITSIHQAKGLEWRVVFWGDLVRWTVHESRPLLLGRDTMALADTRVEREDDQPEAWRALAEEIRREEQAEHRRVWYVAATRAKERLIVSGLPIGQQAKPKLETPAGWLWKALPPFMPLDGADLGYVAAEGVPYRARVLVADAAVEGVELEQPVPAVVVTARGSDLTIPPPYLAVPPGARRHSASEMLTLSRCETKHWFRYRLGLREPRTDTSSVEFIDAVARGRIVHDVLERLREEDELEVLLEDAIGRWDDDAPAPESVPGRRYRKHLRDEIARVVAHPEYRAVADLPSARRELGFLAVAGLQTVWAGHIDLAASEDDGLILLDVKTSRGGADEARGKAERFRPQRDVYVSATEAIASRPVVRFAYQFSRAGVQISEAIDSGVREAMRSSLAAMLARAGEGEPTLTAHPAECRFCGYRDVGWCEGVPS